MKKNNKNIIEGIMSLFLGIVLEIAYICKYCPFNINTPKGMEMLTLWSLFGWVVAGLFILYGLCALIIGDETPKKSSRK